MELCAEYNLRFIIVHDRYSCWIDDMQKAQTEATVPESTVSSTSGVMENPTVEGTASPPKQYLQRPIEELKQRYYQINRLILNVRNPTKDTNMKDLIASYSFDIIKEHSRLQNLQSLMKRSEAQIEEEEHLVSEIQKWMNRDWSRREKMYKWVSHNAEAAQQYAEKSSLLKRKQKQKKEGSFF
jgi:DNA methyltransferase 1-associated protein 1